MKKAFTLIELLVVIAIIAILAAILFPVFAQAKTAAKKTTALSQTKQIGTAWQMYATDHDDLAVNVSSGGNQGIHRTDFWIVMQPYVKSVDVFFSSERTETGCYYHNENDRQNTTWGKAIYDLNPKGRCLGYGYNWGPQIYAGGGVLGPEQAIPGGGTFQPGRSLTSFEEPANLFVFGDTYDTPRPTIGMYPNSAGGKAWILDTFNVTAGTKQSQFRWGGRFHMAYADGHSKSVQYRGGLTPNVGYVYVPAQLKDRQAYCANTEEVLDGSRFSLGQISCKDFVEIPFTRNTQWSPN
ncbi:MAG: prepilin-type N-terminal cleavage/methylation domain-containing protein [Fimbriimonadaceae bacterium]|nr:prepilin-type N-terminal cleavage/methylation domain-containing protein [Fimbriimonadaceae bacterium]QYK56240.1 MAG: prepilin-type N-terminal cleavage/methylation domain-containing protein [Fimbriimonadaceae bacterium]